MSGLTHFWWAWLAPAAIQATPLLLLAAALDLLLPARLDPRLRAGVWLAAAGKLLVPIKSGVLENPLPGPPAAWAMALPLVWLAGVAVLGAGSLLWIRRQREALRPKDSNAAVLESFRAMKKALRVDATLVTTACVEGPVTIGRTVFWPDGLEQHLSRGEQCQVFRHELAHVRRRDGVRELGWWLLVVTFWFHPLVWWGARRMRAIREQCCDRTVAALPGHCAKTYRQALLQVVRLVHLPAPGLALVDPRAPLAYRLAVLGAGRPARWSGIAALLALAAVWPLTGWAERNSNAVAEWVVRPPGSLQLRHMVLERLAQEEK